VPAGKCNSGKLRAVRVAQWRHRLARGLNETVRRRDQSGMAADDLEQRLADLEHRHDKTRALLVDVLSAGVIVSIGLAFKPEGWHAMLFGFCGGFFFPLLISALFLRDRPEKTVPRRKPVQPAPVAPWRAR
jgi:hypothetical protein